MIWSLVALPVPPSSWKHDASGPPAAGALIRGAVENHDEATHGLELLAVAFAADAGRAWGVGVAGRARRYVDGRFVLAGGAAWAAVGRRGRQGGRERAAFERALHAHRAIGHEPDLRDDHLRVEVGRGDAG